MARPKTERDPAVVWNVKLLLFSPEDDDLIALYRAQVAGTRNGAAVAKAAMRSGQTMLATIVADELDDMLEALDGLVLA